VKKDRVQFHVAYLILVSARVQGPDPSQYQGKFNRFDRLPATSRRATTRSSFPSTWGLSLWKND